MRHEVPGPAVPRGLARVAATLRFYERRAARWARVVREWRPGTVAPAPGPRRVLVVRLDAIGDFALWTGAARVLRAWLGPDTHVTLAANELWAELARDATIADDVWPIARAPLEHDGRYRDVVRARVRRAGFGMAISPCFTREMMLGDSVVRWSGAAERIGDVGDDLLLPSRDRRRADAWYTRLVETPSEVMHETKRHAAFLRGLGVTFDEVPRPALTVSTSDVPSQVVSHVRVQVPSQAVATGARPGGRFVVFPGASLPEKRWGAQQFAAVAREIRAQTGWQALVLGAEVDMPLAQAITEAVPEALNLAGRTSVAALVAIIGQSRLVVTGDTAAVHLAAATGVRAICVSGGWHWRRFVPYPASLGAIASRVHTVSLVDEMPCFGCGGYCSLPHGAGEPLPCVARVSVERVLATVSHVLSLPDMQSDG